MTRWLGSQRRCSDETSCTHRQRNKPRTSTEECQQIQLLGVLIYSTTRITIKIIAESILGRFTIALPNYWVSLFAIGTRRAEHFKRSYPNILSPLSNILIHNFRMVQANPRNRIGFKNQTVPSGQIAHLPGPPDDSSRYESTLPPR